MGFLLAVNSFGVVKSTTVESDLDFVVLLERDEGCICKNITGRFVAVMSSSSHVRKSFQFVLDAESY